MRRAVERLIARVQLQTGTALPSQLVKSQDPVALSISCAGPGKPVQALGEDESYRLLVAPSGASLTAAQPLGVLRGIETFLQLLQPGPQGFEIPAVTIEDRPRFPWRGLMLDASRHFMPVSNVKRTLDGMAAVKFNVFHWHLSDNQGFRVESRLFPRLQTVGSNGLYYTQAQVREVVEYARDRGIRVIPEFDVPGHTTALLVAYPSLATEPAPVELDHLFGVFDPVLDPAKPAVYQFLDRFIGEMSQLFPDPYFHIGGDEVNGKLWRQSLSVQIFKTARGLVPTPADPDANAALHALFNQRLEAILRRHGKRMEGWDEILSPALPKDIVIQSWRGQKSLGDAVRLGYQGILSSGWYLDLALPARDHYLVDPLDKQAGNLTPEQQARVLGGEAAMWTEWVTPETVDSRIWPRAAAIAERLWSPADVRDVDSMYRRLESVSASLEWLGLTHRTWQQAMLRRIAGTTDKKLIGSLAQLVEPVEMYERENFGPYTTETPLIHLVDAVPPESTSCREFSNLVNSAIATGGPWDPVLAHLLDWSDRLGRLAPVLAGNEYFSELEPLRDRAEREMRFGIQSVQAIASGRKLGPEWNSKNLGQLDPPAIPVAAVNICATPTIIRLIQKASQ